MALLALLPAIRAVRLHDSTLHGEAHWQRVAWIGRHLAAETPGADAELVLLFAIFHDSQRLNDGHDPAHGARGAALARPLLVDAIDPARLDLLATACHYHADGYTSTDPTIGACWDSDRLDLWRVGAVPDPAYLSTAAGRGRVAWSHPLLMQAFTWEAVLCGPLTP